MDEKRVVVEDSVLIGVRIKGGHVSFTNPTAIVTGSTFIDCEVDWGSGVVGDCTACHWGNPLGGDFYHCTLSFKSRHKPVVGCYRWQRE